MMNSKAKKLLELHEGRVYHAYQDSEGYWTIGVGFLIDKRRGGRIPDKVIDYWLEVAWDEHWSALVKHQPWIEELDEVRQYVLGDMTFNLGIEPFDNNGYKDWPIFLSQVKAGKYKEAAQNMRSTLWAKQVKGRAERLATMMETGQWPKEVQ